MLASTKGFDAAETLSYFIRHGRYTAGTATRYRSSLLTGDAGTLWTCDYEKIFSPDLKSGNDIFAMRGIDREEGCIVIMRSDQYVAHVLPLGGYAQLAAFLDSFMMQPR